ncbi:hypothetical protein F0562_035502 [Nyssa sinensis]|uniref:Uncharacterized protein n=1 Tax=Nyssa sinensis TaxID=561372 RepID=A0A5J5AFN2_9ASTE|nr:hypothetical protein F0562_035502 [Nyssa sinensis]
MIIVLGVSDLSLLFDDFVSRRIARVCLVYLKSWKLLKTVNVLNVMEGGDRSFKIVKKHLQSEGSIQEEGEDHAVKVIETFVPGLQEKSDTSTALVL